MLRKVASKVAWVGRTASMVFGLALVLALIFGVASMAFGASGDNFILGSLNNTATALTRLTGNVNGAAMQVQNTNAGTNDTALNLTVDPGEAPMRVNSDRMVANLNADKVDGKNLSEFNVHTFNRVGPLPIEETFTSNGGKLLVLASGSGFRNSGLAPGPGKIGMNTLVDGGPMGLAYITANQRDIRQAFVDSSADISGYPAGTHTLRIERRYESGVCNTVNETVQT